MSLKQPQNFTDRYFPSSKEIPDQLRAMAQKLVEREKFLFEIIPVETLDEAIQTALTSDIEASYAIEREYLDSDVIKSFVISSLGLKITDWSETDWASGGDDDFIPREQRAVQGIMSCLNDRPLTHEMIFKINGLARGEKISAYRKHPEIVRRGTQVIYEAPDADLVPGLMHELLNWWNDDRLNLAPPIGAALAHYRFVAIHPFRDGNGRVARALAEKALITSRKTIFRPYSLSAQILREQSDYYAALLTGDPYIFTRYILEMHAKAIDVGIENARRLDFLRLFFKRGKFSKAEKSVIAKMSVTPQAKWREDDFYLIEDAASVFQKLKTRGVINRDGSLNQNWRPGASTKPQ